MNHFMIKSLAWALLAVVAASMAGCGPAHCPGEKCKETIATKSQSSPIKILSAAHFKPEVSEASPEGRLLVGRGKDYTPLAGDPQMLFTQLEGSMELRRKTAWKIVEALLEPQTLQVNGESFDVPLWHTWFEGSSANPEVSERIKLLVAQVAACRAVPPCTKTLADIAKDVVAGSTSKNLVRSLTTANLSQVLRQSSDPQLNPGDELGRGFTLFSPAFVEHLLTQAPGVEKCTLTTAWDSPPPSNTQFSPCIPEFPSSAVMVKASWALIASGSPSMSAPATDSAAVAAVIGSGKWPVSAQAPVTPASIYAVQTTSGQTFGLRSIHFSTKDTREWIWISLWWSPTPNVDFGADRPQSIARFNGGVWTNYKMCVTTSFTEKDPAPWHSFEGGQPTLAAALRAGYEAIAQQAGVPPYDKVTSWCSNPNIETQTGNARTNCIGCHQYASAWNPATHAQTIFQQTLQADNAFPQFGRSARRSNFPADFSWSFEYEGSTEQIREAREAQHFEW